MESWFENLAEESSDPLESTIQIEQIDYIKSKLLSGEYTFQQKRGRSKVWNTFGLVIDDNGVQIDKIVGCRTCFAVLKYTNCTSNLVKHKCFKNATKTITKVEDPEAFINSDTKVTTEDEDPEPIINSDTKREIFEAATEWTINNCRPFNLIQDSGLKKLFSLFASLGARYGNGVNIDHFIPHPSTLARRVSRLYKSECEVVKEDIIKARSFGYCISSDIWRDNFVKQAHVSCTLHYIKEGAMISRLLAVRFMENDTPTGASIKKKITKIMGEFDCEMDEDNVIIVTNRGSNMVNAFRNNHHIHCVNHLLNNMIEKAFGEIAELTELLRSCNKLVKFFKSSHLHVTLNSVCQIRCNTVYYTLSSIAKNWDKITSVLTEKNETYRLDNLNLNDINEIAKVLSHIEIASKELGGEDYPTLHLVIPHILNLKRKFTSDLNDTDLAVQLKSTLKGLFKSVVDPYITDYHKIAFFLFPPTNRLLHFSKIEKEKTIKLCTELMRTHWSEEDCVEEPQEKSQKLEIFSGLVPTYSNDSISDTIESEIKAYMSLKILVTEQFNVLQWWNTNKEHFPQLFKLSCRILCIPASSASSERVFSQARLLISENSSNMIDETVFLNINSKKSNI